LPRRDSLAKGSRETFNGSEGVDYAFRVCSETVRPHLANSFCRGDGETKEFIQNLRT
jgi:hypothetical protein